MPYPVFLAGMVPTADELTALQPRVAYKTAATDRTSTVTPADDPDLVMELEAGLWLVRFVLRLGATANSDGVRTEWTTPSGSSGVRAVIGPNSTGITSRFDTTLQIPMQSLTTDIEYRLEGAFSTSNPIAIEECLLTVGTTGDVALAWAQYTSHADASRVGAGSYMRAERWE